jgi:phosphatidylglycerophosphatase A
MNFWISIATLGYIGKLPMFPGTWASLVTLFLWLFIPVKAAIQLPVIIFLIIIGLHSSKIASKVLKKKDPSEVVIDEAIGMSIGLFMIPPNLFLYFLAFILFRYFDIIKPSFIYHVQKINNGWGIILDDILAGLFTLSIVLTLHIIF